MDMYYTFNICIAVCASFIMIASVRGNATLPRRERQLFFCIFGVIIAAALCEWTSTQLDGYGGGYAPLICMLKVIEFSLAPTLAILYAAALGDRQERRIRFAMRLCAAHALLECVLAPFGVVFYVDGAGTYHHGVAYVIYIAAYLVSALFLLNEARRFTADMQYRNRYIPWLVLAFIAFGIGVQTVMPDVRITYLALAIGAMAFYIFYCSVSQQTDALTRVMNRRCFESTKSTIDDPCMILLIDVDSFKRVNDTYGHDIGDKCLRTIGHSIFKVYASFGYCFRTGGDEFCIILKKGLEHVDELNLQLARTLGQQRATFPELPAVTIGYAAFDPETGSFDDAYKRADSMMYRAKEQKKVARH